MKAVSLALLKQYPYGTGYTGMEKHMKTKFPLRKWLAMQPKLTGCGNAISFYTATTGYVHVLVRAMTHDPVWDKFKKAQE